VSTETSSPQSSPQSSPRPPIWKRLLIIPPILIGIGVVAVMVRSKEPPQQTEVKEVARKARVITVSEMTVIPRAFGFGTVSPGTVWEGVAEVSGKVIERHPRLKAGTILQEGTVLLRIDATDYELALQRLEADIRALKAQITEVRARRSNTQASIAIERRSLQISQRELKRKKDLLKNRTVSQAAVDQEERNVLAGRQSVQNLQNNLNLLPAEEARLEAQLAALNIQLEDARRDLDRTTIILPFNARIAEVTVEEAQFAKSGQTVVTADSIDVSEVTAQLPLDKMMQLLDHNRLGSATLATVSDNLPDILGLKPTVRLKTGNVTSEWQGRVTRVSDRVDPNTRTVGVIVAVDNPYRVDRNSARPPLTKNMYVEVELSGPPQPTQIVIPRTALHGSKVYQVTEDNRLKIQDVTVRYLQDNLAVLSGGLRSGSKIVISDLIPAIDGMLLAPVEDATAEKALNSAAHGGAPSQ